jgi:hypothetical protein
MEKTGEQLRDEGMARAAAARRLVLEEVKAIAVGIAEASPDRTCHAGLLVEPIKQRGLPRGNYLGSVFRGWEFTGEWVVNHAPQRHAGMVRVWRLPTG